MGQINANLNHAPGLDHATKPINNLDNETLDENKKHDIKTMNCVKNRIDMLIEDCLNINEIPYGESRDVNGIKRTLEIKPDMENRSVISVHREKPNVEVHVKDEGDQQKEGEEPANTPTTADTKPPESVTEEEKQSSEQSVVEQTDEDTAPNNDVDNDGQDKSPGTGAEEQNMKKKTITTFQRFIDEVFENSLHNIKEEEVKTASNFLKLCSDSLKTDQDLKSKTLEQTVTVTEKAETATSDSRPRIEIPNNRKITLKDHIEKFLEASFREEMTDKPPNTNSTPKNLNVHMLVNDMITRGLKITNSGAQGSKEEQPGVQMRVEHEKDLRHSASPKRSAPQVDISKQTVVIIDDGDKDVRPMTSRLEKIQESKPTPNNTHPHNALLKTQLQGSQKSSYSREPRDGFKGAENSQRPYNVTPERRDPFDPRFADPKFHDNRIDIVPHEVNAHLKREHQFERKNNSKPDPNLGSMPVAQQTVYPSRAPYPTGPTSPYAMSSRGSPSGYHHGNPHHSPGVIPSIHTGHHADCKCPICMTHSPQNSLREQLENQRHQRSPIYGHQHFSPSDRSGLSPMGNASLYHNDTLAGMVRPPFSTAMPFGQSHAAYQPMPAKLVPQRPPIPAPMERGYGRGPVPQDHVNNVSLHSRHPSNFPEHFSQASYHPSRRGDNYPPPDKYPRTVAEEMMHHSKSVDRHVTTFRPAVVSSKEHFPNSHSQGLRHHVEPEVPKTVKHVESIGNESAPLDLSVKKSSMELESSRQPASQQTSHSSHTKLSPTLTFIKHLENSVDKYCQELFSPPSPSLMSKHSKPPTSSRPVSPGDRRSPMVGYSPLPSPHGVSPQGLFPPMLQGRSLPSPHFSGGITMGQPLVDKSLQNSRQSPGDVYGLSSAPTAVSVSAPHGQLTIAQSQNSFIPPTLTQPNFETAGKRNMNSVSKHEPIQNILGNHDSNDILYLYCKVCASTYGSLYGFRKHFRNQHGYEPRAEHTIVHTISGTKSALHIPASVPGLEFIRQGEMMPASMFHGNMEDQPQDNFKDHVVYNIDDPRRASISPQNSSSPASRGAGKVELQYNKQKSAEQTVKPREDKETKCLECPECGRTFQLNDFGSYKRHCRQHGQLKPFGCTDCQLSFSDQKGLKEHYKLHMKESQLSDGSRSDSSSNSTDAAKYSCNNCDSTFLTSAQLDIHVESVHQKSNQYSVQPEKNVNESNKKMETSFAQAMDSSVKKGVPEMTRPRITASQNIVKQAAESMTLQACPDSSWDKAGDKTDQKNKISSEISVDGSDSGCASSVSSNLSQQCSEDSSSDKKSVERDTESQSGKLDSEKSDNCEDNFERYYKHKKFFHHRKRESSISSYSEDSTPNKVAKLCETSGGNIPVLSSTVPMGSDSCDSQCADNKVTESVTHNQVDVDDKKVKNVAELGDSSNKNSTMSKSEARHNLPFVWDRSIRSRKTK